MTASLGPPLRSPEIPRPASIANRLGELWVDGEPDWAAECRFTDVTLHLYCKTGTRPGRKMGHLTAIGRTVEEAQDRVLAARDALLI